MAMDKIIKPEEQEYISPLISFSDFKEKALSARDSFRSALKLAPPRAFRYPDDIPEKPPHMNGKLGAAFDKPLERDDEKRIHGIVELGVPLDEAKTTLASLRMAEDLAEKSKRDVFFRRNVEAEDLPAVTRLETLKIRAKILEKFKPLKKPFKRTNDVAADEKTLQHRSRIQHLAFETTRRLKYTNFFENDMYHTRVPETVEPATINDIVVTLVICKPYNHVPQPHERRALRIKPYWRFRLRGATTLIEMHSLFKCSADYGATMDVVETIPKLTDLNKFKYPSSFMFIHDTFYVPQHFYISEHSLSQLDMSKMTPMIDISLPIRKWMEKKKDQFGPVQVKDIIGIKVEDLVCRLGYPYVYVHQGSCEHVFYFTDLRLMDPQDYPLSFPQLLSDTSFEHNCKVCRRHTAQWIVEGDEMPADPVHMCEACFTSYHFVYQHRRDLKSTAHPYVDPSCLQL
uniref:snRNA-activating protein complex subunit 3 n=2 Tax=Ascaris TaxID=6251 RepID=A0A0M3IA18_ASCLU